MKRWVVLFAVICGMHASVVTGTTLDDRVAASRDLAKKFMQSLKSELVGAMKQGGPVNALDVCYVKAPEVTHRMGAGSGWKVGRTSLKLRNQNNAPDAWELEVLEAFEERKAAGENPAQMEHFSVVDEGGVQLFRYMKAIPTAAVCLNCHGEAIAPAVENKLKELYPQDKARGFREGDIRGAFTFSHPM